jgi:hypothetical protein
MNGQLAGLAEGLDVLEPEYRDLDFDIDPNRLKPLLSRWAAGHQEVIDSLENFAADLLQE